MQRKPTSKNDGLEDFIKGAKDEKSMLKQKESQQERQQTTPDDETDLDKLRRQTYYISELYIQAIEQMAFYEKMDKSDIVRRALKEFIPTKYLNLAIKKQT